MRAIDRDLIRAGHYGQRPSVPHSKAEHMAAPTKAAKREKSSCQLGAVTYRNVAVWGKADIRQRRPSKVAAIALANKIARMVWVLMARGERYKEPVALAA